MFFLRDQVGSMIPLYLIRRYAQMMLAPLIGAAALFYFSYHIMNGDRGILAWLKLRQNLSQAQETLIQLDTQKQMMERRAILLRPNQIDPDMLEEQARTIMNMTRDGEVMIVLPKEDSNNKQ